MPPEAFYDNTQALINALRLQNKVIDCGEDMAPVIPLPPNVTVQSLEKYLQTPTRKTGTVTLDTPESFIRYVNTHKTAGAVVAIKFTDTSVSISAILNGDEAVKPGWKDHRALLNLIQTKEWSKWTSGANKDFHQAGLSEHLEDFVAAFREPNGAEMIEIIETLRVNSETGISSLDRKKGQKVQLIYSHEVTAKAGTGATEMEVPEVIKLAIIPFEGAGDPNGYVVSNKFKWKQQNRGLVVSYEPIRTDLIIKDVVKSVIEKIKAETSLDPFIGTL